MKIIEIYTGKDLKSYFKEHLPLKKIPRELGNYSAGISVDKMYFREFLPGEFFDWHNAPQSQYIIYMTGIIEVKASGGETRQFQFGEILLANDLTGAGHQTRTLTSGQSIIITASLIK